MTTQTNTTDTAKTTDASAKAAGAAVDAAATVAKSVINTNAKVAESVTKAAKAAKPVKARASRKTARKASAKTAARKSVRKATARKTTANPIKAARNTSANAAERIETMTKKINNAFNFGAFETVPGFAPFQNMMSDANGRGQDFAKKSQKVAEEFADLAKANVEAMVEAGKIAVEGSKSLGQDVIATGRDGVEQASDAIRSFAEAKSPTEYVQLQGEFARASFDRMVAETSKLTEKMVKLAGEAFQPIQNRASKNAERFNSFVA